MGVTIDGFRQLGTYALSAGTVDPQSNNSIVAMTAFSFAAIGALTGLLIAMESTKKFSVMQSPDLYKMERERIEKYAIQKGDQSHSF